jgi:hypothetical protein
VSATGVDQTSQILASDFKDLDPSISVPDGSKVGMTVTDCGARFLSNGGCIGSAGGLITAVGTMPGDGAPVPGNANFKLFTVKDGAVRAIYSTTTNIWAGIGQTLTASVSVVPADSAGNLLSISALGTATIRLNGTTSATASGPATIPRNGGTATITFSAIKDSGGNTVPDGTQVVATVGDCVNRFSENGGCISSAGGTITNGGPYPSGGAFRLFTVNNGSVSVDYSPQGASTVGPTVRISITSATFAGVRISINALFGGVWTLTLN